MSIIPTVLNQFDIKSNSLRMSFSTAWNTLVSGRSKHVRVARDQNMLTGFFRVLIAGGLV